MSAITALGSNLIICWWKSIRQARGISSGARHNAQHDRNLSERLLLCQWM